MPKPVTNAAEPTSARIQIGKPVKGNWPAGVSAETLVVAACFASTFCSWGFVTVGGDADGVSFEGAAVVGVRVVVVGVVVV